MARTSDDVPRLHSVREEALTFFYGCEQSELNEMSDPFFVLSKYEEEIDCPLAFTN